MFVYRILSVLLTSLTRETNSESLLSIMIRGLSMGANSDAQTVLLVTENKKKTHPITT